jgi:hypothetical protein
VGSEINEKIWTVFLGKDIKNILLGCTETREWGLAFVRKMAGCE